MARACRAAVASGPSALDCGARRLGWGLAYLLTEGPRHGWVPIQRGVASSPMPTCCCLSYRRGDAACSGAIARGDNQRLSFGV